MVNSPLIRPYLLGGGSFGGGYLRFPRLKFRGCRVFFYSFPTAFLVIDCVSPVFQAVALYRQESWPLGDEATNRERFVG